MMKKEQYVIAGLLGLSAIVVLWYLSRHAVASGTAPGPDGLPVVTQGDGSAIASYPNSNPIPLGDIVIGASPINLTYNQQPNGQGSLPTLHIAAPNTQGTTPGCCDDCDTAGQTSILTFPPAFIQRQADNLVHFGQVPSGGSSAPVNAVSGKIVS